jgi:hypothetical protein
MFLLNVGWFSTDYRALLLVPEDRTLCSHNCENLKSYTVHSNWILGSPPSVRVVCMHLKTRSRSSVFWSLFGPAFRCCIRCSAETVQVDLLHPWRAAKIPISEPWQPNRIIRCGGSVTIKTWSIHLPFQFRSVSGMLTDAYKQSVWFSHLWIY